MLAATGCSKTQPTPAECPHAATGFNDSGFRCICEENQVGSPRFFECCDPDIGNPCPVCCYNPREADGGRSYRSDQTPVCYC